MNWLDWIVTVVFGVLVIVVGVVSLMAFAYDLIPALLAWFAVVCCVIALVGIGYYIASIGVRK